MLLGSRGRGGAKYSLEWISCGFLRMTIFTLFIHEYVNDGIVQKQLRKRFQFYKKLQYVLLGGYAGLKCAGQNFNLQLNNYVGILFGRSINHVETKY